MVDMNLNLKMAVCKGVNTIKKKTFLTGQCVFYLKKYI